MFSRLLGRCIARSFSLVARFIGSQHKSGSILLDNQQRLHEPDSDCCRYLLVCPQHQHPKQRSYCIRNPVIPVEHAEAGELLEDFDGDTTYSVVENTILHKLVIVE